VFGKRKRTGATRGPGPSDEVVAVRSERERSARALAESVGAPVLAPDWWPEDVGKVTYTLDRSLSEVGYRIWSLRPDGTPVSVVARPMHTELGMGLPEGNWHRVAELEPWDGLVSTQGAHVRAVVQRDEQIVHLIGYGSEADVVRAAVSLRRRP
jgi:hypothetical protein